MKMGIDISRWQGNIDLQKAKNEGVEFCIIKAGGGDSGLYKDSKYERNYSSCESLGIPSGAYFFGQAMNVAAAQKEADYFVSLIAGKKFDMGVWYDVEAKMLNANGIVDIVNAFLSRLKERGYECGVYASESVFKGKLKPIKAKRWVAKWSKSKPSIDFVIWQYGGETNYIRSNKIAGVTCDQNYYVGEITPDVPKKTNEELAKEVLDGKWGNGAERKRRLTQAGYDYMAVQKIVNKLCKPSKMSYHIVKRNDTLSAIANKYGITLDEIMRLNPDIKNPNLIYPGQKVRVK